MPMRNKLKLALAALLLFVGGHVARADDNVFDRAIQIAQARTVKIYGASIGREPGYATGVLISADGQILTASSVYLSGNQIKVVLPDGVVHEAKIERRSTALQTAILKIDAKTPDFFTLSEKPNIAQGDWVMAVSNLFKVAEGREKLSVTLGVVSLRTQVDAKHGTQDVPYDADALLIDCITSNPGAAGGAVVDIDGNLVGMIGKIIEGKDTNTRLNYAVPVDLLAKFVIGQPLTAVKPVDPQNPPGDWGLRVFKLSGKKAPAYIDRVLPNTPAAIAGLKADDLVISIGRNTVRNVDEFEKALAEVQTAPTIQLTIKRQKEVLSFTLKPVEKKP